MNRRLVSEIKSVRRLLVLTVGLGSAAGLLIILQAVLLTHIVNGVFLEKQNLIQVWPTLWVLLGAIALRALLGWLSEVLSLRAAIRVKEQLRMQLAKHLFRLGPAFLQREQSGELVNTAFEGIEQLEPYLARYLPQVSLSTLVPLAILVVTFSQDLLSGIIMVITAPVIVVFMILIGKTAQAAADKQWRAMGILSAHFFDVLRGLSTLKLFNRSLYQTSVIAKMSEDYRRTTMGTLRIAFLSSFVLELMATLGTAMIAVGIGLRLLSGHLSFADGFVVLLLAPEFYAPIRALGTQYHASINGVTAADRILDILSTEPLGLHENPQGRRPRLDGQARATALRGATHRTGSPDGIHDPADGDHRGLLIEFSDVDFAYRRLPESQLKQGDLTQGDLKQAVHHLSFSISAGEKVAIVGATGAGKSTIVNLLLGFLRPTGGSIRVAGVPLEELDTHWWTEQVSYVPQTSHLFRGSITENLRMAKKDATPDELKRACKMSSADEFIEALPNGYDTLVGEMTGNLGGGFSGGQIQRLALARAFLKNSPILILDEPTAHLDVGNEGVIEAALDRLLGPRTALIVAHRLSTIARADRIIVLDNGIIVGQGRHEELLLNNQPYRELLRAYRGEDTHRPTGLQESAAELTEPGLSSVRQGWPANTERGQRT